MAPALTDGLDERVHASRVGRIVLSIVAVVIVVSIVSPNLPAAPLSDGVADVVAPVRDLAGLDGRWNVFAPAPRAAVIALEARLEYGDGRVRVWRPPAPARLVGSYRYAHWQKYMEQASSDAFRRLWRPLAVWLAGTQQVDGEPPVTVVLVRRWRDLAPPDEGGGTGPWQEFAYFTYQVDPRDLG
jgi:hypothetical protein